MKYIIRGKEIYTEDKVLQNGSVVVSGDKIVSFDNVSDGAELIDLSGYTVLPGLIDIHAHGGSGVDTMDLQFESLNTFSKHKMREGVTSFCPTTATATMEDTRNTITLIKQAKEKGVDGAKIIGSFLEGPYLAKKFKGAHEETLIRELDLEEIKELVALGEGSIHSVAIAPDKPFSKEVIEYLASQNIVVRIGHTGATFAQATEAIEQGATIAIHTYNAMSSLNHREPGMVGAVLTNPDIYGELICDFVHVHPTAVDIVLRCKEFDKTVLITDCMRATGLPDGEYTLGPLKTIVKDSVVRLPDGTIAGSTLTLIRAVQNVHQTLGVSLADSVKMASLTPATAIGRQDTIGSLKVGKQADLIAIDEAFCVVFVMIDGVVVHKTF